ncbi:hypothetical protein TI03_05320 [Achromatium sp. WMS1]|nr:hypothetical protein TI03_05320 [Achromatium sp. WMS1]
MISIVRSLNNASRLTSIIVSHDVRETASIADKLYLIANGKVMDHGTPNAMLNSKSPWVRQFMDGLPDGPVHFHYPAVDLAQDLAAHA